ncbi:hypothetical protein [Azotobacter vinelandii]|uniref:hypothetical protein n=1 Tax=Azotobacter vinelandii TaxID=354 RepID=UPI000A7CA57E
MSILIETLAMAATVAAGAQAVTTGLGDATDRLSTVVGRLATESLDTAGAAAIGRSRRGLSMAEAAQIDEEQGSLMPDGAPRKQTFTLEFRRYGDDYAND